MALMLNRLFFLFIGIVFTFSAGAQEVEDRLERNTLDYKDPEQFRDYNKRRKVLAYWQIEQLKKGALVVRLRNNRLLIDELNKSNKTDLARQKLMEQYAMNKNTMMAYLDHFRFCKVYFIYSNSSDSLLNGIRKHIFLDTNLNIDPSIELRESFYLLAERDYGYNSTIGFVKEDSAKFITERGTAVRMMAAVLKNKFGHQLKSPFPYLVKEKNFLDADFDFPMTVEETEKGLRFIYTVDKNYFSDLEDPKNRYKKVVHEEGNLKTVHVKKQFTYEKIAESVSILSAELDQFYKRAPSVAMDQLDKRFLPFLY